MMPGVVYKVLTIRWTYITLSLELSWVQEEP